MGGAFGNLRLYSEAESSVEPPAHPAPDPLEIAYRELIRPPAYARGPRKLEPFSAAWFAELERKRYARHGSWLPAALEFDRHPGESVLLINPGVGSDAIRYRLGGSEPVVVVGPADHPHLVRANLTRCGLAANVITTTGSELPFGNGAFDVAVLCALHDPAPNLPTLTEEIFRVLKSGGKVIGLFPARYDAGYWQDVFLPLQRFYWRRPSDPVAGAKTSRRELLRVFSRFTEHRVRKRHLRRSELPHLCRVFPLVFLERLCGRVLVLKAFKPISSSRNTNPPGPSPGILAA